MFVQRNELNSLENSAVHELFYFYFDNCLSLLCENTMRFCLHALTQDVMFNNSLLSLLSEHVASLSAQSQRHVVFDNSSPSIFLYRLYAVFDKKKKK